MPVDPIVPDTKDWTWVVSRPCEECGLDVGSVDLATLPERLHANAALFASAATRDDAAVRPLPGVWSPLEYACHVRDVHRMFDERLRLMVTDDDPLFANWDQDETAAEGRYAEQDPALVAREVVEAASAVAGRYAAVAPEQWTRPGRRSNGSAFTVDSLARYHLHDVLHHAWDVGVDGS